MAIHRRLRQAAKKALAALPRLRRPRKPKGPRKAQRRAPYGEGPTIDERLAPIAAKALAGQHVECAWEFFCLQYFPGWEHERVAAALGLWSTRQGYEGLIIALAAAFAALYAAMYVGFPLLMELFVAL
jgi:hypothetical protein